MKLAFVHKYKWSHADKRKCYKKLLKNGEVKILSYKKQGWLYGHLTTNRVHTHNKGKVMKLTLEIETTDKKSVAEAAAIVALLGGTTTAKAAPASKPAKGKAAKAEVEKAEVEAEEEFNFEEETTEPEVDEFDLGEEQEEPAITVEDIIKAFAKYNEKHGREKAIAILKKLKVKSARDIDPKNFEKVMAQLKK